MKLRHFSGFCSRGCLCSILCVCLFVSSGESGAIPQENNTPDKQVEDDSAELRVDLVVVMDDQKINQLRQSGGLQVKVPRGFRGGINSLVIKQEKSFLDRPMVLAEDADRIGENVLCKIDQSILSHLPYQPIRIQIYHSNYASVLISFQSDERVIPSQLIFDPNKDSGVVWANLRDGRSLPGNIRNGKTIKFKSQLGELPIPWEKISRVEFQLETDKPTTIVMANGDQMKGHLDVKQFEWLTRWGTQTFDGAELTSISRTISKKSDQADKIDDRAGVQSK